jgi:hypothetical protein
MSSISPNGLDLFSKDPFFPIQIFELPRIGSHRWSYLTVLLALFRADTGAVQSGLLVVEPRGR